MMAAHRLLHEKGRGISQDRSECSGLSKQGKAVEIAKLVVFDHVAMAALAARATTHAGKGLHLFRMRK